MPNLTKDDVWRLTEAARKVSFPKVRISDLKNRSDRTLTVGTLDLRGRERVMRHVYIRGGKINIHDYIVTDTRVNSMSHNIDEEVLLEDVLPAFQVAPQATDLEFAELVLEMGSPLRFSGWGTMFDVEAPIDGIYYGYSLKSGFTQEL